MPLPSIADAEWLVMTVLWDSDEPLNGHEIVAGIPADSGDGFSRDPVTLKSHVQRLLKKGAIQAERRGRTFYYSPAVDLKEIVKQEAERLMDKIPESAGEFLVSQFLNGLRLSEKDVEKLRRKLDGLK